MRSLHPGEPAAGHRSGPRPAPPRPCGSVAESDEPWAALGAESAARLYGAAVLRHGVEDEPDNITRFVWMAPEGAEPSGSGPWRTSLVFSELGEDHPGALVEALQVFSGRDVNLTRIESRPLRRGLGRYQFFLDIEGASAESPARRGDRALRSKAESVRVLGSWPIARARCSRRAGGREDARARVGGTLGAAAGSWGRPLQSRGLWATGPPQAGCGQRPCRPPIRTATSRRRRRRRRRGSGSRRPPPDPRTGAGPQRELRAPQRLHRSPCAGSRS